MNFLKIISVTVMIFAGLPALLIIAKFYGINLDPFGSFKAYVVSSGSMEKTLPVGSVIITEKKDNYLTNEIITFTPPDNKENIVTHRIIFKTYPEGIYNEPSYFTAGDRNKTLDPWEITENNIIGKVDFPLPYLGYGLNFLHDPKGYIIFIIVPITIIIYEEIKSPMKEIQKKYYRERNVDGILYALIIYIASASFIPSTHSLFNDHEKTTENYFSAAAWENSPKSKFLVINEILPDTDCFCGNTEAQWIEIYNPSAGPVNLKNYKISDGTEIIAIIKRNLDLPAGKFVLLAHDGAIWNHCYQGSGALTVNLGGRLNLVTGLLQLINADDKVIDTVIWGGVTGINPAKNRSIERSPLGKDSKTGTGFEPADFIVQNNPSPGSGIPPQEK